MPTSSKNPKVSVVIPTYNLRDVVLECLDSVAKQSHKNVEIIVVDNASIDGTSEAIRKKFPKVKLIKNKKNLGVTGGVNVGIKHARGDYIWLVDHDNILNKNMLSVMIKLAKSNSKIGVVVPKIYYFENRDVIWAAGAGQDIIMGLNIFRGGIDEGQYEKVEEVQVAVANFLVKKEVINQIGGFDDVFFISYEDTDFSFRARKAGYKIIYTPKAICYHKIPLLDKKTSKQRWLARSYWAARNKIIFMRKHGLFFPLFMVLYPVWLILYTYQAVRYLNFTALINFYKGIISGYKYALFEYENRR